ENTGEDGEDNKDEDEAEDEDEDEDDILDFDEDSSTTQSDKASNDTKQKDSPDNPMAENATGDNAEEQPTKEFIEEGSKGLSADSTEQPSEKDSSISNPTIPSSQTKVKQVGKEAVDSLMLDLTFETVRKTVTLAELKSIKPGYTFISQNPVNSPIEIRANGKLIGYGKLVSVDGNIGVQVTEFI
ncbi:MAG: FliM/FliN family flagellar motor switch protein, partial [Puniceicoccales bacterium]|nr:FliM/FliN family flagellar motor switch protein [Puniceicoccales bacterium]